MTANCTRKIAGCLALRPDGKAQYLDVTGNFERFAADPYHAPKERDPRVADVDVLILGGSS